MSDQSSDSSDFSPTTASPQQESVLNQSLGEILQNNNQAQNIVMQSMKITPEQLQQLLNTTGNNELMNMKIGDLVKNGFAQQAVNQSGNAKPIVISQGQTIQMSPEQLQQIINANSAAVSQSGNQAQIAQVTAQPKKKSFFEKLTDLFK